MIRRLGWAVALGVSLLLPQRPKVARLVAEETQRKLLPIMTDIVPASQQSVTRSDAGLQVHFRLTAPARPEIHLARGLLDGGGKQRRGLRGPTPSDPLRPVRERYITMAERS